jgi:hypothetical protein
VWWRIILKFPGVNTKLLNWPPNLTTPGKFPIPKNISSEIRLKNCGGTLNYKNNPKVGLRVFI